jgi:hypothetical protein
VAEPLMTDEAHTYGECRCGAPLTLAHECYSWPAGFGADGLEESVSAPVAYLRDLHERWQFLMAFYQGRLEREAGERAWRADLEDLERAARAYREAARVQVGALDGTLRSETRWAVAHLARCQAQERLFAALAALDAGEEQDG